MSVDAQRLQRSYYGATAARYDDLHVDACDEHHAALEHVGELLVRLGARSVLDTGCGTGRGIRFLRSRLPHLELAGNDPSPDLLQIAVERYRIPAASLRCASSERLPYADDSFDAVVATGVLHHVPDPDAVVREMLRVARKAVFVSDANVYGQGPLRARVAKLALRRLGLLDVVNRARRDGRDWYWSDDDGVAYSYSVFDSLPALRAACVDVGVVPTSGGRGSHPLTAGTHALAYGLLEELRS